MHTVSPSSPTPDAPSSLPAQAGPLSPEHFDELARAEKRAGALGRALSIATFNAWLLGIMAALSLLMGMFDVESMTLGIGLAVLSFNEFRGRRLLRGFNLQGPRVLGWNQIALMLLLVAYAVWKLLAVKTGANPYQKELDANPDLAPMLGPIVEMYATLTNWFYAMLILIGFLYQGGNALYYFSRAKHLQAYLDETPAWVVKLKQATGKY